jgi:hypothetical protein
MKSKTASAKCVLNPKPAILNPKPSTLNPQPSTLDPKLTSAVNYAPLSNTSILDPQPSTPTLKPQP